MSKTTLWGSIPTVFAIGLRFERFTIDNFRWKTVACLCWNVVNANERTKYLGRIPFDYGRFSPVGCYGYTIQREMVVYGTNESFSARNGIPMRLYCFDINMIIYLCTGVCFCKLRSLAIARLLRMTAKEMLISLWILHEADSGLYHDSEVTRNMKSWHILVPGFRICLSLYKLQYLIYFLISRRLKDL